MESSTMAEDMREKRSRACVRSTRRVSSCVVRLTADGRRGLSDAFLPARSADVSARIAEYEGEGEEARGDE